jgi:hypothetical protein
MGSSFIRQRDVFIGYIQPQIKPDRTGWDNLSEDDKDDNSASNSFDGCRVACEKESSCLQFSYAAKKCKTSKVVKLGKASDGNNVNDIRSGWLTDRINTVVQNMEECDADNWILP